MASYPWARTASNFLMDRSGCSCTQPHATTRWIFRRLRARGADFRFPGLDEQEPRHTNVIHVRNSYRSPHERGARHPRQAPKRAGMKKATFVRKLIRDEEIVTGADALAWSE